MELLQYLLPNCQQLRLEHYDFNRDQAQIHITVASTQTVAPCPVCSNFSSRVHSHYERTLQDLSLAQVSLTLQLQVRKFFCGNPACIRRIFTERIPQLVAPWARKTVRLSQHLQAIGIALGGAAGSRLAHQLGFSVCGSTLLSLLKQVPLPPVNVPKILGVDDFAFRKGQHYGTIVVDLEQHRPVALLPDRKAETLVNWLLQHPGIEVVSRDRSKVYRSAITEAAPDAVQVADRFHLVQNLREALERVFSRYGNELKAIEHKQRQATAETLTVEAQPTATVKAQAQTQAAYERRVQQQQQIRQLDQQGWTQAAIAEHLSVCERTVGRYLSLPTLAAEPPHRRSFGKSRVLEAYKPLLLGWWNDGIQESQHLLRLLQQQGYNGSQRTVQRYLRQLRQAQGQPPRQRLPTSRRAKVVDLQLPPLTARHVSYLVVQPEENRDRQQQGLLEQIVAEHEELATAVALATGFLQLLRAREADGFEGWLTRVASSGVKSLEDYARGLVNDYGAVKASMMSEVSNGAVEGLNNRLKLLKRQMYGRAGLELLQRRFLLAS